MRSRYPKASRRFRGGRLEPHPVFLQVSPLFLAASARLTSRGAARSSVDLVHRISTDSTGALDTTVATNQGVKKVVSRLTVE